jgi:hypothetical protein
MATCLASSAFGPAIAAACEGGGGEKEFPISMSITPSPWKYTKAENKEFVIKDESALTHFEIENVVVENKGGSAAKIKPKRECVTGKKLFPGESCKEHVEYTAPFETGARGTLVVETLFGNGEDELSS